MPPILPPEYPFSEKLEEVADHPATLKLCVQYLETHTFRLIFQSAESSARARFVTEDLSWDERTEKIGQLLQVLYNSACRRSPRIEYANFAQV